MAEVEQKTSKWNKNERYMYEEICNAGKNAKAHRCKSIKFL